MSNISIVRQPIFIRNGKTLDGKATYKDYGMSYAMVVNAEGVIVNSGMIPSGKNEYCDVLRSNASSNPVEIILDLMPIVRDNPDVGLDATGNYPGRY